MSNYIAEHIRSTVELLASLESEHLMDVPLAIRQDAFDGMEALADELDALDEDMR